MVFFLKSASNPHQAILAYKNAVVQELAVRVHEQEEFIRNCKTFEDGLFSMYEPRVSSSDLGVKDTMQTQLGDLAQSILSAERKQKLTAITEGRKRQISAITDSTRVENGQMEPDITSNSRFTDQNIISATKRRRIGR